MSVVGPLERLSQVRRRPSPGVSSAFEGLHCSFWLQRYVDLMA